MSSKRVTDFFSQKYLNIMKEYTQISKTQVWNKRMIQTWIKIKMKGLSSKKGNFSIHQNIMFFQIIKNRGSRSILPATLVQHFSMFTWWWKLGNSLNFNSPISWHLWWELCMLLKILCYLESQYFCLFLVQQGYLVTF